MDENGNMIYMDDYDMALSNISTDSLMKDIDAVEDMLKYFKNENKELNDIINNVSNNLMEHIKLLDLNYFVNDLTDRIIKIDSTVNIIKDSIRIFREMYGNVVDFSIDNDTLIDMVIDTKNNLKGLKQLQVINYYAKVEIINKKIAKLKAFKDIGVDDSVVALIDSLKYLDVLEFEVTDWKYNKHKNINYNEIDELSNTISLIEDRLGIVKDSVYVSKLDGLSINLDKRINDINNLINDNMSLDDIVMVKQGLRDVANLVYNFGTELYLYKDNVSDLEHKGYLQFIRETRNKTNNLNNKLVANKVYKNIKDELDSQLNDVSKKLDIFLRYVNIHYGNANKDIVEFDRKELVVLEIEFSYIESKIKSRKEQLIDSQYDRLIRCCEEVEKKFFEAKEKIYDDNMIKRTDLYSSFLEEIENGLQELEDYFNQVNLSINSSDMKDISNKINYLNDKIASFDSLLTTNRDKDSKEYGLAMDSILGFKERLSKVSIEYEEKKPLRVKMIKSGKNIYEKHNKLILTSAGIIAITLLLRKFLLIPAIMHGNIMVGTLSPALQSTTAFFNKILGGMIGASMDLNGVWHLANGLVINASVATTSLLKGLVTGVAGFAASIVPMLILSIKELVEEMKIKERLLKFKKNTEKDVKIEEVEVNTSRRGK